MAHAWPGNLRQLSACLRTLAALAEPGQPVDPQLLPVDVRAGTVAAPTLPASGALEEIAEAAMRQALAECQGNVSAAAKRLGINRSTLYRRLGTPRG
ncbi:Limonene hydroxylase [compost metagenome]